jgi:tetratricopeptide (TPR) repeat protein
MNSKESEEIFDRGINYFRAGFYSSALNEFYQLKKIAPDYPNIDYIIEASIKKNDEVAGQVSNFIEENFDKEVQELSEELTFENSSSNLAPKVRQLLKQGKFNAALKELQTAESIVPDSRPLLMLLANTYRRLGMLDDAEHVLKRARVIYPDDNELLNNLGNIYMARGMYTEAEEAYRTAMRNLRDDPRILNNLGVLRMQTNNLDDAENLFRKASKLKPQWKTPIRNLEHLASRIEILEKNIDEIREEYRLHPTYLDVGLNLGKNLFFRGFYSEAKSVFKNILNKNPKLLPAWFYLGSIYEINHNYDDAIECYCEMVKQAKKEDTSEYKNFLNLSEQGFVEEAVAELKKVAVVELDIASSRINLGIKYFEDCLWNDALRHFEEAMRINNTYPDAYYWTAITLVQLKRTTKAKELLNKAIELNPNYADAYFQLGLLLRSKAKKKAAEQFKKALTLNLRPSFAKIAEQFLKEGKS